ncbi:MAG: carboxylesterase family protein [Myxococcales bacterium]
METPYGTLRGTQREGHVAFLGVPFAAPPVGDRRFAAPEPPAPWEGTRDATAFGASAPQDPLSVPPFRAAGPESEDCLYLNVYTPGLDAGRRPVLFWIHGGGFSHGSGSQPSYDGGPLARRGDVVVVSINYRLGALGYLYLGGHGGADWGAASNAGQLDQIAALRWVHENIAAFGGDPQRVTIFGESAGAVAVSTLMAMPAARGLFSQAIAQSGTANRLGDTRYGTKITESYLQRLGISDADPRKLRAAEVDALLQAQGPRGPLSPVIDGRVLPQRPIAALREGVASEIPLLIGTNRDEQKLYTGVPRSDPDDASLERQVREVLPRKGRDRAAEAIAIYRSSRRERGLPSRNYDIADAIMTASRFRIPAIRMADAQFVNQPRTFLYQFDWESPARRGELGACHGLEVPFVWGTVGRNGNPGFTGTGADAGRLSERMMDAWTAFAKTGDPSHPGIGQWPAYSSGTRPTMIFGSECGVRNAPFEEERALWESML